ncbi:MAG TPA: HsmA family protein [Prolixibacteraceae bacterium]|nr:HsmA family protein [Prolixibacteraceae bacterium]
MTKMLILSTSLITLALIFYSLGVWAERMARYLKGWHVGAFWIGFVFDVAGTLAMGKLSDNPFDLTDMHTLTGQMALWLMLAHAAWATMVVRRGSEKHRIEFHTYSIMVWMMWLIPYIGGMWMGMSS